MNRPTRATRAGQVYLELRQEARRRGRGTDELLVLFALERFLFRLAQSVYRQRFVLKGGMWLAAFNVRRPTRDIDMVATGIDNDVESVVAVAREIAGIEVDDGMTFWSEDIRGSVIRDADVYPGARVTIPAELASAKLNVKLDCSFGDPIVPAPTAIMYPTLVDSAPFSLLGYPIESVLAEKIETMIRRGDANSRERDFADTLLLIRVHAVDGDAITDAIEATADHRRTPVIPLGDAIVTLPERRQVSWTVYLRRAGLDTLPNQFSDAITEIATFGEPVLANAVREQVWLPAERRWLEK